jgi:hypothetical protein
MSQNHTDFRPAWYQAEMDRIADQRCKCAETWTHPTDVLFLIAFVAVMTAIFVGWFA